MKVLYLANIPSPYRVEFFNLLAEHCDLTVLYERRDAKNRHSEWGAGQTVRHKRVFLPSVKVGNEGALAPSVIRHVLDKSYDVVVIGGYATPTGMLSIAALRALGIPFVLNADGGFVSRQSRIRELVKTKFIGSASAWLSTGKSCTAYLRHYGARPESIYDYPFSSVGEDEIRSAPPSTEDRSSARRVLGIAEEKVVLAVGSFIPRKGFDVLIEASSKLGAEVGIYVVGGEPSTAYLEQAEAVGADRIHFRGFKSGDRLKEYYRAADVFVLPTREDIWGLVVNEAMAEGLPVVTTTRCGAGLEMVEEGKTGALVSPGDAWSLGEAVASVLASASSLSHREASLEMARKFTIEKMVDRHVEVFIELLQGK